MIQRQYEDLRVRDRKSAFDEIDVLAGARQLRHIDREVGVRHHSGERIHDEIGVATAGKVEREVILRIVQRPEERDALNMIEMEMAKEDMRPNRTIAELLFELFSEKRK